MFHTDRITPNELGNLTDQLNNWLGDMIGGGLLPKNNAPDSPPDAIGLNELAGIVPDSGYRLGESFIVWTLEYETIESQDSLVKDLSELIRPTDRRHHQLRIDQKPIAYAWSIISENETICQVFVSKLAEDIQQAMAWIDDYEKTNPSNANTDPLVRLLTIPSYDVTAFWIYKLMQPKPEGSFKEPQRESNVVIISAPSALERLRKEEFLDTRQFLGAFAGHLPAKGLG